MALVPSSLISGTPLPLIRVNTQRLRSVEERLRFFAEQGRYFTNNDITESRDHALDSDEFVYPVFRLPSAFSSLNPTSQLFYTSLVDPRTGWRTPLNMYRGRLAAQIDRELLNSGKPLPPNPYDWYVYSLYSCNATLITHKLIYPLNPITQAEFNANEDTLSRILTGLGREAHKLVSSVIDLTQQAAKLGAQLAWDLVPSLPIDWQLGLSLLLAVMAATGTFYFTGNLKMSAFVGGGLMIGLVGLVVVINTDDIFYSAFKTVSQ